MDIFEPGSPSRIFRTTSPGAARARPNSFVHVKKYVPFLLLALLPYLLHGQSVGGLVTAGPQGQPLPHVRITLDHTPFGTVTGPAGTFRLDKVPPGYYQLRAEAMGYAAARFPVTVAAGGATDQVFALQPVTIQLNAGVVVTAQRFETDVFNRPEAIAVMGEEALRQRVPRTVPEALLGAAGVFVQKTNHGGGSPFVRGLTGQQTLLLVDGIRVNNATFRSGPNQYLNTFDPQSLERIEVLRGAGSVQYGSDALGGVVHLLTRTPSFTESFRVGGSGLVKYGSSGMERTARGEVHLGSPRFALLGGLGGRRFGDIRAGGNLGFLRPTGYDQLSGDVKARFRVSERILLTAAYSHLRQERVPLYHRVQLENYQYAYFHPQTRQLGYVRLEGFYAGRWVRQVQLTGSYQRFLEGRRSRRNDAPTFTEERDDTGTRGGTLTVHSEPMAGWHVQSGAEGYFDRVGSSRREVTAATGDFTSRRGLYPDGSTAASLAVYSLHSLAWRKFTFTAGGRYNAYRITVPESTLGTATLRPAALVGNAGVSYAPHPLHRLTASVHSAFRAPNVDDLGTLGIVDFRYELPNAGLSPEKALGYELGWKARTDRFSASVAAYHNGLSNIIGRVRAGGDSIQGYPVYLKENVAKAAIRGLEAEAEVQLARGLAAYGGLNYAFGQNQTAREPFRRIPPLNGRAGLSYGNGRPGWLRAETLFADRQDRLAAGDVDDNRIGPGGTPGWWIVNLNGGYAYRGLGLSAELHNLLDRPYKTHGSGVYGPGRSLWVTLTVALERGAGSRTK